MNEPLLSIKNLRTHFDTGEGIVRAVDDISLDIQQGEVFCLLGESGCGKSITALSLLRLVPHPGGIVSGSIALHGEDLCQLSEAQMRTIRGRKIAMIFQEPMTALNPVMTIGEQIAEPILCHLKETQKNARKKVLTLLDQVGIADPDLCYNDYPHHLSGGMKQRVMIAMALSCEPEILIADEPTTALDVTIQAQILNLLRGIQKERGMAILFITHDLGVVSEIADQVAVMYAGQIVERADKIAFFENPMHPYSKKLFDSLPYKTKRGTELSVIRGSVPSLSHHFTGCRFVNRCHWAWEVCEPTPPKWIEAKTGEGVLCHLYDPNVAAEHHALSPTGPTWEEEGGQPGPGLEQQSAGEKKEAGAVPLLSVSDLAVHFPIRKGFFRSVVGAVKAVDGVSFEIHSGETVALVGESGCGKTTTGKAIIRLTQQTGGRVSFRGLDLSKLSENNFRKIRKALQMVFQDPYASLNPRMTIGEILCEGLRAAKINRIEWKNQVDQLLEQVGLSVDAKDRYPHEFSGGQRQRIAIARALSVNPSLIVCDEPTSALDVSVQAQILNLLKSLQRRLGLAYLFITHNLSIVEYFADYVAVMYLGKIVEYGTVEQVFSAPQHPYTEALLSAMPKIDVAKKQAIVHLEGDIPSPAAPPPGCYFHTRCPHVMPECKEIYPAVTEKEPGHGVACHLYDFPE
ncbi:MAG: ABC transporter ATP-binding protein [Nitrospirota bacterium]